MSTWVFPTARAALLGLQTAESAAPAHASPGGPPPAASEPAAPLTDPVDNPLMRCDCGRTVGADVLVDVTAFTPAEKPRYAQGATYLCDACTERMIRERRVSREEFFRRLGAPAAVLEKIRRKARLFGEALDPPD